MKRTAFFCLLLILSAATVWAEGTYVWCPDFLLAADRSMWSAQAAQRGKDPTEGGFTILKDEEFWCKRFSLYIILPHQIKLVEENDQMFVLLTNTGLGEVEIYDVTNPGPHFVCRYNVPERNFWVNGVKVLSGSLSDKTAVLVVSGLRGPLSLGRWPLYPLFPMSRWFIHPIPFDGGDPLYYGGEILRLSPDGGCVVLAKFGQGTQTHDVEVVTTATGQEIWTAVTIGGYEGEGPGFLARIHEGGVDLLLPRQFMNWPRDVILPSPQTPLRVQLPDRDVWIDQDLVALAGEDAIEVFNLCSTAQGVRVVNPPLFGYNFIITPTGDIAWSNGKAVWEAEVHAWPKGGGWVAWFVTKSKPPMGKEAPLRLEELELPTETRRALEALPYY